MESGVQRRVRPSHVLPPTSGLQGIFLIGRYSLKDTVEGGQAHRLRGQSWNGGGYVDRESNVVILVGGDNDHVASTVLQVNKTFKRVECRRCP